MSQLALFAEPEWGTPQERERQRRIKISVAAYAYEVMDDPMLSDAEFDSLAQKIDRNQKTGDDELDYFFFKRFVPYTGQWILQHPKLEGIERLYNKIKEL